RILKSGVQSAEVYVDLWQTITAGDTWRGELCNRRKNGELFWESLSISPIVDAEGAITHFVAVKEDITSRRQMEEEIRRSEIRFRTIFEGSNDAIMLLTQEGFFDCNARTLEMFGFETREEFTAVHPADVSPPQQPDGRDSMEAAQSWIETAFREGHCRFEWMHRRTSGEDFPVEVLLSAFQYGEETVLEATVRDIAERKQAEEAMRTSEAFLQSTLDALSAHIAVLDEDGTILTVNEPWRRFAADNGYCHDDCGVGVNYLEQCRAVVGPERSEARDVAEGIRQVIDGERNSFKLSYACHSPDQKRWFTMHVTQLHDRDGNRVVVAHENVTELQQAEQELREAMEAAETANRAKSIFLANMSHEIRTPLNAILGFSQLMQRDSSLVPGQRENLNTINRSGEHLLALINDVLEMSKIEAGRVELVPETFDLKAMVHDMESMFQIRARSAGLKLDSEVSPNVPQFVHGDQGKIRQVLINLLSNAVKFTREGGAELLVNVETAPPGYRLIIQVRDTGIGIAADELSRVFDQFEQTNAGLKSQGGTGLGLAISREYARLMSGDITVASEPGKGSTFQFECDLREGQEGEVTERIDERRVVALATGSPDFKVLIVDDIEQNRLLLNRLLKHVGFQVREAADGQEALQIFRDWSPDIVLMDMAMPVMDGYEATRRIKAMDRGSETPVVAVTASALDEARREVAEAGADDFISKPFREAELFEALSRHLDVQYAYDMCDSETSASESGSTMATIKLDRLPKALVEEMRAAVDQADLDQLLECISAVEAHDEHVASHLRQLAEAFDYEVLETLLRGDA
ncbi:MAG: PAS domain S-box protein, partial [Planctomycetota bacterium]|nr:PAS domain S-box protein [Planctomycetota bacterium]